VFKEEEESSLGGVYILVEFSGAAAYIGSLGLYDKRGTSFSSHGNARKRFWKHVP
jgi:hypothetical protein